jgi:hypothetical protein
VRSQSPELTREISLASQPPANLLSSQGKAEVAG